ncbi:MAG TPA: hypothetical protein VGM27_10370 [Acidobacteriaceae bacterium]
MRHAAFSLHPWRSGPDSSEAALQTASVDVNDAPAFAQAQVGRLLFGFRLWAHREKLSKGKACSLRVATVVVLFVVLFFLDIVLVVFFVVWLFSNEYIVISNRAIEEGCVKVFWKYSAHA